MGLDITKITNAELQTLANTHDKDKNHVLDEEEFQLFKEAAGELETVSARDYKQAIGLYISDPVEGAASSEVVAEAEEVEEVSTVDPTEGMTEKQAAKFKKEADETHIKYLESVVKDDGTRADLLAMLDNKSNLDPEFKKAVKEVMDVMQETYASSSDIKHKDLVKALEAAGIKDDIHKKILEQLEKMAKNECIAEQTSKIADAYAEKTAAGKTSQEALDEIKKEAKEAGTFKGDFKTAFNKFDQPLRDAYQKVYDVIAEIGDLENGAKVQDKAEQLLRERGQWDKYTKKALLGDRNVFKRFKHFLTGYKGNGRIASDNRARQNKVEHKKIQTTEEIMKSLGNNTHLFVAMQEAGFIKKMDGGKWDLTDLSDLIYTQVGADYKQNRDHSKDKLISEKLKTQSALRAIEGLSQLSESEAQALVKLCGYEIEGKNWARAIFQGLLGAAGGAAVTGGSAIGAAKLLPQFVNFEVPYYKDQPIDISAELMQNITAGNIPDGVSVDASGHVHIITDLLIKGEVPRFVGQLGKLGLYASVPGALIGATMGVLSGLKDKGQTPVLSNNFSEKTFEEYCHRLEVENPEYAIIGRLIATSFIDEDGVWDREGYKDFLNTMGGDGGLINREELIGGLQKRQQELKNKKPEPVEEKCSVEVDEKAGEVTTEIEDKTYIHYRKENPGVGWKEMVEAYYPGLIEACGGKIYGPNGAIRAFQRELCTDEDGNFDAAKLRALINATDVPKEIKLPLQVNGIDRVINKPTPVSVTNTAGAGAGTYRPAMDKVGRDEVATIKKVGPNTYIAKDGCDSTSASGSTASEAVQNLKKTTGKTYKNEGDYIK